mmetsp:Transcript_58001/g.62671  ORF Transcript_58001/g.62671 Transcript_58001/m.62671 type:complete len:147 (+) Transcript_58001:2-442(+)
MYATTMVTASVELNAIMYSATLVTAEFSEDDIDIYAKNLDTSDEYDEGYMTVGIIVRWRNFKKINQQKNGGDTDDDPDDDDDDDEHCSNIVPMMICTKCMTKVSALKSIRKKKMVRESDRYHSTNVIIESTESTLETTITIIVDGR